MHVVGKGSWKNLYFRVLSKFSFIDRLETFSDINFPTTLSNYKATLINMLELRYSSNHKHGIDWNKIMAKPEPGFNTERTRAMGKFQVADMDLDMHVFTKP